jgi:hypothetical protein
MMAIAIPAAIRRYSMAVAPDPSFKTLLKIAISNDAALRLNKITLAVASLGCVKGFSQFLPLAYLSQH